MLDLSVIIVTYNSCETIRECIEALPEGLEILCIDNASTDATGSILGDYSHIQVIENQRNLGFSAGCNQGIALSKRKHLLFCNPDAIVKPGAVERMDEVLREAPIEIAGVGPKLVLPIIGSEPERVIDSTGIVLNRKSISPCDRGHGQYDKGQYDSEEDYFGPSCACAMYRKNVLEEIAIQGEIFDEDFFAYYEDVDLAWRARNFGYEFQFVPDAMVEHDRKNPDDKATDIKARAFVNRYFCAIKNDPRLFDYFPSTFMKELFRLAHHVISKPGFDFALSFYFSNLMKIMEKRRYIQARRAIAANVTEAFDSCR